MGIEPFLVATSVNLIVAQRLIRRICQKCKEPEDVPIQALLNVGFSEAKRRTSSCSRAGDVKLCNQRGYKGSVGLFEVMKITDDIRELILSGASAVELRRKALEEGMIIFTTVGSSENPRRRHHHRRGRARERSLRKRREGRADGHEPAHVAQDHGRPWRNRPPRHDQLASSDPDRRNTPSD